ncbi:MAG: TolC family protein [Tannerella sp.]|jgi:outer membrane protein TolC|nr:TolC family protein [Tannerella sp.]
MTKKKLKVLATSMMFALLWAGEARSQQIWTLQQCVEFAVNNSYSVHNAELDVRETAAKTKETRAALLPQADASAALTDNLAIPVVMLPGEIIGQPGEIIPAELGVPWEANVSVQLSQVIFNPALFTGIKVARNAEELSRLKSQMTKEQLIYDVASVYYDILDSEQQLKSISGNLCLQDSLYAKTELRVKEDLTREIDLNRIKVNIADLKVKQEHLSVVMEQQKRYLQLLAGMPANEDFSPDSAILTEIDFPKQGWSEESVLSEITELAVLKQQKELNILELKTTQMKYMPTLSLVAAGAYQFQSEKLRLSDKNAWFKSSYIGLRLSIPIFDGTSKHHAAKQIKLQGMKLDNDIAHTEKSALMERKNARSGLIVSYKSAKLQDDNLRLAEKVYAQSQRLYQEGLYTVTDLLQTENSLREAQISRISEIIRLKKAELNLMKAERRLEELKIKNN